MRSLEWSKDLTSFKCEMVSLPVSLNSFHLYLLTNSVNLSVFEYIYIYIHIWWWRGRMFLFHSPSTTI